MEHWVHWHSLPPTGLLPHSAGLILLRNSSESHKEPLRSFPHNKKKEKKGTLHSVCVCVANSMFFSIPLLELFIVSVEFVLYHSD